VKDLCTENYKILMNKIEGETKKLKIFCVHGMEELILLKCP
jgi:hypothetical protein